MIDESLGRAARLAGAVLALALCTGCITIGPARFNAWIVNDTAEILARTPPAPENDIYSASRGSVRLSAARGETVAFQLVLSTSAAPQGPFDVAFSDFAGPATLPATRVAQLYRVQSVRCETFPAWYPEHTGRPAAAIAIPDIAVPWEAPRGGGPLTLDGSRNEIVWADLSIPGDAAPGDYTGTLVVRRGAQGAADFQCQVELRVLPVELPADRGLPVYCRIDPRDLLSEYLDWPREPAEETRILPNAPQHQAAVQLLDATMVLFHEHRATPILWASFPKLRPGAEGDLDIDWQPYDLLVGRWIDGTAFADRAPLAGWPLPVSLRYPDAQLNGGIASPQYARLLGAYLNACCEHFKERGWLKRAFVRPADPADLTPAAFEQVARVAAIVRAQGAGAPLMAHLPAQSLRGLGWFNAPQGDLAGVAILAPPAQWFEAGAMKSESALGRQTWFMPDRPPYSPSLATFAPAADARTLAWAGYRYGARALWVEDAAAIKAVPGERGPAGVPREPLIYSGLPYGLRDRPVASLRLKRLRRGLFDYALLSELDAGGKSLLARTIAQRVVRWAFTDATVENLLSTQPAGWPRDDSIVQLAQRLIVEELAGDPNPDATQQIANLAAWSRVLNQDAPVEATCRGVRLTAEGDALRAHVYLSVLNRSEQPLSGSWSLRDPPVGWSAAPATPLSVPALARRPAELELELAGISFNTDGIYPVEPQWNTQDAGSFGVPARLAVAACPAVDAPPRIDGDLSDWPRALNNSAGDFRLCVGASQSTNPDALDQPTLATQAWFCMDRERIYVAVQCALRPGEPPKWTADNIVPIDGNVPWGQDLVELLISPNNTLRGAPSDLLSLQIKPSGVAVGRQGAATDPPMGPSREWQSGARVAVKVHSQSWIVEAAIPLAALGPEAIRTRVWGFNVARLDARRGEYSSWSGARGHCYAPERLGNLLIVRP